MMLIVFYVCKALYIYATLMCFQLNVPKTNALHAL